VEKRCSDYQQSDAVNFLDPFWHFSIAFWSLVSAFRVNKTGLDAAMVLVEN